MTSGSFAPNGSDDLGQMCEADETKKTLATCFKQVALDNLGRFYLYSFNSLHEQFYNHVCFLRFLIMVTIIGSLFPYLIPLLSPSFPAGNNYLLDT